MTTLLYVITGYKLFFRNRNFLLVILGLKVPLIIEKVLNVRAIFKEPRDFLILFLIVQITRISIEK